MAKNVVWQSYQINDEDGANITNFKKRRRNTLQKRLWFVSSCVGKT